MNVFGSWQEWIKRGQMTLQKQRWRKQQWNDSLHSHIHQLAISKGLVTGRSWLWSRQLDSMAFWATPDLCFYINQHPWGSYGGVHLWKCCGWQGPSLFANIDTATGESSARNNISSGAFIRWFLQLVLQQRSTSSPLSLPPPFVHVLRMLLSHPKRLPQTTLEG